MINSKLVSDPKYLEEMFEHPKTHTSLKLTKKQADNKNSFSTVTAER